MLCRALDRGAEINTKWPTDGATALIAASLKGHREVVQALLTKGAEVNARRGAWRDRVDAASFRGDLEVVQALLAKGADVNAERSDGQTAMDAAKMGGHPDIRALLTKAGAKDMTAVRPVSASGCNDGQERFHEGQDGRGDGGRVRGSARTRGSSRSRGRARASSSSRATRERAEATRGKLEAIAPGGGHRAHLADLR